MRWVWRGFCAGLPSEGATGIEVDRREGREVAVRWTLCTPETVDEVLPAADRAPVAPEEEVEPAYEQPLLELGLPPAPRALAVSRLSYSGSRPTGAAATASSSSGRWGSASRRAARRGAPGTRAQRAAARLGRPRAARAARLRRARRAVRRGGRGCDRAARRGGAPRRTWRTYARCSNGLRARGCASGSRLRARPGGAAVRIHARAVGGGRSLLVNGVVDVYADEGAQTLVVDWKSEPSASASPRR